VTPRSWEHWKAPLRAGGLPRTPPGYPGFKVDVEALNADPTPIENLTVPAVIDHLVEVIGGLEPPILMGHSAGGIHPAHAGSRLRRGGRGDQLGCYRGRAHGAAVAAQDLQPPVLDQTTSTGRRPRSCWHPGWVSDVSGKTHPRRRPLTLPQTDRLRRLEVRQRGASRRSGWLRQSETTTGAIHLRRRGPPHAPAVSSAPTRGITSPTP
jgi:hypothetical protein